MTSYASWLVVIAGCAMPSDVPAADAMISPELCTVAGRLTLYVIPPSGQLDWSTPNRLLASVIASGDIGSELVASGAAHKPRPIGHVNVELDCGEWSAGLTGQTGGGTEWQSVGDGAGILLREMPGAMNDTVEGDAAGTAADIELREQSGKLTRVTFTINRGACARIKSFIDKYLMDRVYLHYGGTFRVRRMEGGGCASFGTALVDVAGLLPRSQFTQVSARSLMIGSGRIADFLGKGYYPYGSNLLARDTTGVTWSWPRGQNVPAPNNTAVWLNSPVLDAWSGPEDQTFTIPGLVGAMQTQVPYVLYDPAMMASWAEAVWADATAHGRATAAGGTWLASTVGKAHEITYEASCVPPQTIGFADDNDDLFLDSDAL